MHSIAGYIMYSASECCIERNYVSNYVANTIMQQI